MKTPLKQEGLFVDISSGVEVFAVAEFTKRTENKGKLIVP